MHQLIVGGVPQVDDQGEPILVFDSPEEEAAANAKLAAVQKQNADDNAAATRRMWIIGGVVAAIFIGFVLYFGA